MRLIAVCASFLLLAGCAESGLNQSSALGGGTSARPKIIVVSDFVISPDLQIVDRGFTTRLERKIGEFPTHERKQRTLERVNDEIVAALVATLRESGLEAQPGSEEGLSLSSSTVVVSGKLRPSDVAAKKNAAGIGDGKSGTVADMSLSSFSSFGKRQLLAFTAEPVGGKLPTGKQAAAGNALIAEALVANKAAPEKLSPDAEGAARRIGRSAGDKIVAYGKAQGWFSGADEGVADAVKPEVAKPEAAKPEATKPAAPKLAAVKLEQAKPAQPKPAARKPAQKPEMVPDVDSDDASPAAD